MADLFWKDVPLGFALVDESNAGALIVHHVSVSDEGAKFTGMWEFLDPENQPTVVRDRLTHWIVIGTRDGIDRAEKVMGHIVTSADLAGLVLACEKAEQELVETWEVYRDEEPKKRANLKPLAARTWPSVSEDGDAAKILKRVGKLPFPESTPNDSRDILALARLIAYVIDTWFDLETDRISRAYLNEGDVIRRLYPTEWLTQFPPYWPKAL